MTESLEKNTAAKEQRIAAYLALTNNDKSLDVLQKKASDFRKGIREDLWSTGFGNLDEILDGGLHGSQLVCVGAISSLGKTSFVLQMANQIARNGQDVLFFSLEMSREELNAKTISRYSLDIFEEEFGDFTTKDYSNYCFTTNQILKGDISNMEYFQKAIDKTREISSHTYIYVGNNDISVDDIKRITAQHIEATGRKPVVFIDYLQILVPSEASIKRRYDVRRCTNDDITSLKVLARENNIPVVVISAFNRASYTDSASMSSFRESSGIEYSSDVMIGLQYKGIDEAKDKDSANKIFENMQKDARDGKYQQIDMKILKNRNGARGTLNFIFYAKYNRYFFYYDTTENSVNKRTSKQTSSYKNGTQDSFSEPEIEF